MDYNEYKERVRSATDIADVIGRYVDLKKAGTTSFKGLCPFHGEKTPSFFVMEDGQFYYCHGCHKGGDVFQFLCDYNNLDFTEAVNELAEAAGIEIPETFDKGNVDHSKKGLKARLFEMHKTAAQFFHKKLFEPEGEKALEYLKGRGISSNTIVAFGMGYAPRGGESAYRYLKEEGFTDDEIKESGFISYKSGNPYCIFRDRVMFPIMNKASKVIAFGGRRLDEGKKEMKYINSYETEIYKKKDNLFGIQRAMRSNNNRFFLVEGYMDVVSMQQAGFLETVASLGTAFTQEQADLLARISKKVYLIYDADESGIKAMSRAIPIMKDAGIFVNVADMSPFKDPDELLKAEGKEGLERRIRSALNSFFFELDRLAEGYDRKDSSENGAFELKVAEKLADIGNRFEREQNIRTAAGRYGIDVQLLTNEVNRIGDEKMPSEGIVRRSVASIPSHHAEKKKAVSFADEKNVLMYITKVPEYIETVKKYIDRDMFSDGLIRSVASLIYDHYDSGQSINVARIMAHFHDEDMGDIGSVFSDSLFEELEEKEQKRLLSDSVLSMLRRINEQKISKCGGGEWKALIAEKKRLEEMSDIFTAQ